MKDDIETAEVITQSSTYIHNPSKFLAEYYNIKLRWYQRLYLWFLATFFQRIKFSVSHRE